MEITTKPSTTIINKTGSWRTNRPKFIYDKCPACAICPRVCPEGVIYQTNQINTLGKLPYDCDLDYCKGCGLCAQECPFKAIEMELDEK
ncbi:MAG: 4Fe-4S binding protein [Parcubacteria group bacterium]|nr:4Fe-4S binding protein [Parcubacteria group bacterium]